MNHVLLVVISLSVSGSILALALFALSPLVKKRLSQTWQYYIWLIVILRFLLPFSPEISLVGQAAQYIENRVPVPVAEENGQPDQLPLQAAAQLDEEISPPPASAFSEQWRELRNNVWMIWAAGALMLFSYKIISYNGFLHFVRGRAQKVIHGRLLDIYREERAVAKVGKLPLRVSDRVGSPMLIGFFRPTLVIPIMEAGDDELRHIFRHELTHYKRFDYCYKWLVQITKCLHWFNPLIYRINKQIDKCCELSCDEANIRQLDEAGRKSYGNALMASLVSQENYSNFVISMTMSENANLVKERLDAIMEYSKQKKAGIVLSIILAVLLFAGGCALGTYSNASASNEEVNQRSENSIEALPSQVEDSDSKAQDDVDAPSNTSSTTSVGTIDNPATPDMTDPDVKLPAEGTIDNPATFDMTDPDEQQPEGTKDNPATFDMTDPDASGTVVINLNNNGQKMLLNSSSFRASDGQVLTLQIESTISGAVDLFLFSPSNQEQRITIGGNNDTITVNLSEGVWGYNCTGFFDSGDISILGTIQ